MFRLTVRDHIMIAHSFKGEVFGPAQRLHGATFIVDLELFRPDLDENGIVADIGLLSQLLTEILAPLNYQNLDGLPEFSGRNTTTEVLAREICERVRDRIKAGALGEEAGGALDGIKVIARRIPCRMGELRNEIAVVMRPLHLVVPGSLDQRTGGYLYDKRIVEGLRAQGREVVVHELAGDFPLVDAAAREAANMAVDRFAGGLAVIDGLALPALHDRVDQVPTPWVALVHHPLAMETGLAPDQVDALMAIERQVLRFPARLIVTSHQTVGDLAAFDVAQERIGVVLPGTDPAPLAAGSGGPGVALLCVASLTPRKGHLVLLQALAELVDLDWYLNCVGSADRDPDTAVQIRKAIEDLGLRERVTLAGEQDEAGLAPYYDGADVFVLASYHEGYGMALAEALARGLPVVSTNAGAIPGTVPSDAGILVEPGDTAALAEALGRIITERPLRNRLAAGARAERDRLPSWDDASRLFAEQLDQAVG